MTLWAFVGEPVSYGGGADRSADVDHGFKFTLRESGGREATVNVEAASGVGGRLHAANARAVVARHLTDDEPPPRIVLGTDGVFRP